MRYGIDVTNFGEFGDVRAMIALAQEAEAAGWDGFFIWDHLHWTDPPGEPLLDPWVTLSAIASNTSRIKLGALVTPLPRRRPWQVARATATLDHLSDGRLIFGAGIGGDWCRELSGFGEETDDKRRAAMLDEGLEIVAGLWSGEPFSFAGQHYNVENMQFVPAPQQQPRIPVWIAGIWPNKPPFRRAARWDGIFPIGKTGPLAAEHYRELVDFVKAQRADDTPFDVIATGITHGDDPAADRATVQPFADAGVTWWLDDTSSGRDSLAVLQERVRKGPPRLTL